MRREIIKHLLDLPDTLFVCKYDYFFEGKVHLKLDFKITNISHILVISDKIITVTSNSPQKYTGIFIGGM